MSDDHVDIRFRLRGQREALAGTKQVAGGIKGIGDRAGTSSRKVGLLGKATRGATGPFRHLSRETKGLAKNLLAVGAGYATVAGIKGAVNTTVDLGKATLALNRNLNDVGLSSGLASVFKQRGIDVKQANMSLTKLATTQDKARHGDEKSLATLKRLGISQKEVRTDGDDLGATLFKVADGLGSLERGNKRTALAQQLFGRGAQKIVPLLDDGSKSLRQQLGLADEYGATLSGKNVAQIKEYIKSKREMDFAEMGWQITMGTLVLPTLNKGVKGFATLSKEFRDGTGTGGEIRDTLSEIGHDAQPTIAAVVSLAKGTFQFAKEHPNVTKAAIALLAVGRAVSLIKTSKAISGLSTLVGLTRGIGRRAGAAGAVGIGDGLAMNMGGELRGRKGKLTAAGRGPMKGVGRGLGKAMGLGMVAYLAADAPNIFADIADKMLGKGNPFSEEARKQGWRDLGFVFTPENLGVPSGPGHRTPRQQRNVDRWRSGRRRRNHLARHPFDADPLAPLGQLPRRPRARAPKLATTPLQPLGTLGPPFRGAPGPEGDWQPINLFVDGKLFEQVIARRVRNNSSRR